MSSSAASGPVRRVCSYHPGTMGGSSTFRMPLTFTIPFFPGNESEVRCVKVERHYSVKSSWGTQTFLHTCKTGLIDVVQFRIVHFYLVLRSVYHTIY